MNDTYEPVRSPDYDYLLKSPESSVVVCEEPTQQPDLNERHELAKLLRGQQVRISDLHSILQGWPEAINIDLPALRIDVDKIMDNLFPPGKQRFKLKAADLGLFGAMWWPYASPERLRISTSLAMWLFVWDDEFDSLDFSDLGTKFEEAQAYRATSLQHIHMSLALDCPIPDGYKNATLSEIHASILESFTPIGLAMVKDCTLDQRRALMRELDFYIKMTELEQRVQLDGNLPSVASYMRRRMGSGAVGVLVAVHEYALGIRLPQPIINSPSMKSLWDETNVNICIINDIFSMKKEVALNLVDTLIPLLFIAHERNLQAAMDAAAGMLRDSVARFDLAAKALLAENAGDELVAADLAKFIDSCRYACTANLNFSIRSARYGFELENLHGGVTISI